jgi:ribosomal protein L37AE/L43A
MKSFGFGKLRSSSSKRSGDQSNNQKKPKTQPREVSSGSDSTPTESPFPLPTDSSIPSQNHQNHQNHQNSTGSYFSPKRRRGTDNATNEARGTDDYGLPFATTPTAITERGPPPASPVWDVVRQPEPKAKSQKCRTCNKAASKSGIPVWKCEQCNTVNAVDYDPNTVKNIAVKPISISSTRDILEKTVEDAVTQLVKVKDEQPPPSTALNPRPTPTSRNSMFPLPLPPFAAPPEQRRGSEGSLRPMMKPTGQPQIQSNQTIRRQPPGTLDIDRVNVTPGSSNRLSPNPAMPPNHPPPSPRTPTMTSHEPSRGDSSNAGHSGSRPGPDHSRPRSKTEATRDALAPLYKHLEEVMSQASFNVSFSTVQRGHGTRSYSEGQKKGSVSEIRKPPVQGVAQMDHKSLMIGDVTDVAFSLVNPSSTYSQAKTPSHQKSENSGPKLVDYASPHIDWKHHEKWWELLLSIGLSDTSREASEKKPDADKPTPLERSRTDLGYRIRLEVLRLIEQTLTDPFPVPTEPDDVRFLLILLACPLLQHPNKYPLPQSRRSRSTSHSNHSSTSIRNSGITRSLSLILGHLANLNVQCHNYLINWFSRYSPDVFKTHVEILMGLISERLSRRRVKNPSPRRMASSSTYNGAPISQIFDENLNWDLKERADSIDWQLEAACKVLSLFARANDSFQVRSMSVKESISKIHRRRAVVKQLLPTEHFYSQVLDSGHRFDPVEDFKAWDTKTPGMQLCQFPFLLPLATKIRMLEYDSKHKMASRARRELLDALFHNMDTERFFHLNVRRDCIIEDSLQRISEAIYSSEEEAKKELKVRFEGEEGVDAGGLRKEWFLLLVEQLFDPDVGTYLGLHGIMAFANIKQACLLIMKSLTTVTSILPLSSHPSNISSLELYSGWLSTTSPFWMFHCRHSCFVNSLLRLQTICSPILMAGGRLSGRVLTTWLNLNQRLHGVSSECLKANSTRPTWTCTFSTTEKSLESQRAIC